GPRDASGSFFKKGAGGDRKVRGAHCASSRASSRPATPTVNFARPGRASLRGCPKRGGRRGGAGRSRARRRAVPGHRPPGYTQHVNSPRREEPRDRREPEPPGPAACPRATEPRAARPGGGRRRRGGRAAEGAGGGRRAKRLRERRARMDFQQLADVAEKWCSNTPFELIATEETERRMDFYADPGVSFYVLCPDNGCGDNFHVWSESEDCLPFLQLAQDYISSCGKKTLHEVLEKVFKSFRPLLGLPDADDDAFEEYSADVEEEEPEADHPQMGVSQQ
uniref:Maturin n=1 Tax=Bos taurus TaxID=9913 RepID=A0AAA9TUV8_BOVIN